MELFIGFIVLMTLACVAASSLTAYGFSKAESDHKKEKERKLALLKEHPELAKEIWQSIEDQELRHHAMKKNFNDALQKAGNDFQKAVTPAPKKPKSQHGLMRVGLAVAKRLAK